MLSSGRFTFKERSEGTLLGCYRKLIAQKHDGSDNCRNPGRPRTSQEITDLVIQFKQENPHWGYTRIKDNIAYLGYKIGKTTAKNILLANGYDSEPDVPRKTTWKEFIRSHWSILAVCDFFSAELLIKGKLIRCMVLFPMDLSTRRVEILGVRSIKEECLNHLILSSEEQLRYVRSEYLEHDHHERIHQGLNRIIEPRHEGWQGATICIERLGGLLRSRHRTAA